MPLSIPGPPGPPGEAGPEGPAGEAGAAGPAGTVEVVIGETPPEDPQVNVIWIDTGA